jgi:hypothetical protein
VKKVKVRNQWDRQRHYAIQSDELVTEQSHAPGCNLHLILTRYTQTGQLPLGKSRGEPQFMDCPDMDHDFKYMQDTLKRAESEFYNLPIEEQAKHDNNPSEWLRGVLSDDFIDNPEDTEADADEGEALSEASPDLENETGKEAQSAA